MVANLSEEQRASVRQALDDLIQGRAGGRGPVTLTLQLNAGIGMK